MPQQIQEYLIVCCFFFHFKFATIWKIGHREHISVGTIMCEFIYGQSINNDISPSILFDVCVRNFCASEAKIITQKIIKKNYAIYSKSNLITGKISYSTNQFGVSSFFFQFVDVNDRIFFHLLVIRWKEKSITHFCCVFFCLLHSFRPLQIGLLHLSIWSCIISDGSTFDCIATVWRSYDGMTVSCHDGRKKTQ